MTNKITVLAVIIAIALGIIFISCHSGVQIVDRHQIGSVSYELLPGCCAIHSSGNSIIRQPFLYLLRGRQPENSANTDLANPESLQSIYELVGNVAWQRLQAGRSPMVKLHSYLALLFSQGILNPRIYDLA